MKRIKKYFYFLIPYTLCLIPYTLSAQDDNMYVPHPLKLSPKSSELGIFLGGSYYTGDLNPSGHLNRFTRPAAGALYRVNFNPRFSAKAIGSFGMKVNTAKRIGINFEWGLRKTFTDYIDDVSGKYVDPLLIESEKGPVAAALSDKSKEAGNNAGKQRGNSYTKDWYSFVGVIITFKLKNNLDECDVPH